MPDGTNAHSIHKAVLGLNGGPTDELVVHLGCQLAKLHSAELVAIHVIEVNWQHELSDEMTDENLAASSVLDLAEGIAEKYKVKLSGDLLQAASAAHLRKVRPGRTWAVSCSTCSPTPSMPRSRKRKRPAKPTNRW